METKRIAVEASVSARCIFVVPATFDESKLNTTDDGIGTKIADRLDSWLADQVEATGTVYTSEVPAPQDWESTDYDLTEEE